MPHRWVIHYLTRLRPFDIKKPVKVYRNLTKNTYSIMQRGLVVAHARRLCLSDVSFVVSEAGRQRVLREGRKNVHAYAVGRLVHSGCGVDHTCGPGQLPVQVTYNPYRRGTFWTEHIPARPIVAADFAVLNEHGIQAAYTYSTSP